MSPPRAFVLSALLAAVDAVPAHAKSIDERLVAAKKVLDKTVTKSDWFPAGGCDANTCRPSGGYTGDYSTTTWKGDPTGCTNSYCDHYLPGGTFYARCSAAPGSLDRDYADTECAATCAGTCAAEASRPIPPAPTGPSGTCWVFLKSCPNQASMAPFTGFWFRDDYGEKNLGSGDSESVCLSRGYMSWCGIPEADGAHHYLPHVPAPEDPAPSPPAHRIVDGHAAKDGQKCAMLNGLGETQLVDEGHPDAMCAADNNHRVAGTRCCRVAGGEVDRANAVCDNKCERVTFEEAEARCAAKSANTKFGEWRLCTEAEVMSFDDSFFNGCKLDYAFVWVSDTCDTPTTPAEFDP